MSKGNKPPRLKQVKADKGKRISAPSDGDVPPEQLPPVFSLRYLRGDYCITYCSTDEQAAFAAKLHRLSQLTWSEIQSQHRHKLGYERIPQRQINSPIPPHLTEDVNLIAFRFDGMNLWLAIVMEPLFMSSS
jgi:hypothetical protein